MKKLLGVIICLLLLFLPAGFAQNRTAKQAKLKSSPNKKLKKSQAKQQAESFSCQLPVSVTSLNLSQSEISENCLETDKNCSNNKIIDVFTVAIDIEDIKYVYTISAGKIIGEGANIKWDLSDVKSGNYTITAGISQPIFNNARWEILGTTQTKIVTIKE